MENVTDALYIAFAMLVFIMALSYSMYMINRLNVTSKVLVYGLDETNHYEAMSLADLMSTADEESKTTRIVGIDTIIPTLYRYYKESYSVKILDQEGNLMQYFDTTTEGAVMEAMSKTVGQRSSKQQALISLYGTSDKPGNLFGAPWMGNTNKDTKARIDMYIEGGKGYINNILVDYSREYTGIENGKSKNYIYLNYYNDRKFKEIFTQYAYEGDTLTTDDDELISVTGSKQIATKIIITYQLLPPDP